MRLVSLDGPINVKEQTDGAAALDGPQMDAHGRNAGRRTQLRMLCCRFRASRFRLQAVH